MINRTALVVIVSLLGLGVINAFAQGKKKKPVATKTNVEVVSDADSLKDLMQTDSLFLPDTNTTPRYFLFPEFYSYWPIAKGDTVIKFQCYDAENSYINVDTLHNVDDIRHIHFVKVFTNFLHTFIDGDGKPKASSASRTIYKYDKTDNNTWKSYDYSSNFVAELKEFKSDIVRRDTTTVINPLNDSKHLIIRKYYKVVEQRKQGEIEQDK